MVNVWTIRAGGVRFASLSSGMSEPEINSDLNRTDVMWMLFAKGQSFVEMIPPLQQLGLLTCQESHRKRPAHGGEVCESCEATVNQSWRRYLAKLGATKEDAYEVRGTWLHGQETVARICMERYRQEIEIVTTRTEMVARTSTDAAGVVTTTHEPVETTTVRKETKIHTALLRLYLDVRDKVARVGGLNIDKAVSRDFTRRRLLATREVLQDGDAEPTN